MNARMEKARQMMSTKGYCLQISANKFNIRSQSNPDKRYMVSKTGNGLVCECPDHKFRKVDCKHIKITLHVLKKNKCWKNNMLRIMKIFWRKLCCQSIKIS